MHIAHYGIQYMIGTDSIWSLAAPFNHLLCICVCCALCKSYDHQLIRLCGMTFFDLNNHVAWIRFRNIIIYLIEMTHTQHTHSHERSSFKLSTHKFIHSFLYLSPVCRFYLIFAFFPTPFWCVFR